MAVHHLLFATAYIGLILSIWVFIAKKMDLKLATTLEFLRGVIIKAVALLLAIGWAASVINKPAQQRTGFTSSLLGDTVQVIEGADKDLTVGNRGR
jgi:hypothetical protein